MSPDIDVAFDSVNMLFMNEDNILDQIYEKQICSDLKKKKISIVKMHIYIRKNLK